MHRQPDTCFHRVRTHPAASTVHTLSATKLRPSWRRQQTSLYGYPVLALLVSLSQNSENPSEFFLKAFEADYSRHQLNYFEF